MIQGSKLGRGEEALALYLTRAGANEQVEILPARGVVARTFPAQLREIVARTAHGRTKKPILHLHVAPSVEWTEAQYARHLELYEREFDLTGQPRLAVFHRKQARGHRHYVWSRVRRDGSTIRMAHDYPRREKISRILEYEFGHPHVAGRHNRAVAEALRQEGRLDVVVSMQAAGLLAVKRPKALTPQQRQGQDRTGVPRKAVAAMLFAAWRDTADGHGFRNRLEAVGFSLAKGTSVPVAVDRAGNAYPIPELIADASEADTGMRVKAAVVHERIATVELPPLSDVRLETRILPLLADLEEAILDRDAGDPAASALDATGNVSRLVRAGEAANPDTDDAAVQELAAMAALLDRDGLERIALPLDEIAVDALVEILAEAETIDPVDLRRAQTPGHDNADNQIDTELAEIGAILAEADIQEPQTIDIPAIAIAEATEIIAAVDDLSDDHAREITPDYRAIAALDAMANSIAGLIDDLPTPAGQAGQSPKEHSHERQTDLCQTPASSRTNAAADTGTRGTENDGARPESGRVRRDPPGNKAHREPDRPDRSAPARRPDDCAKARGPNPAGPDRADRPKPGAADQPRRGNSSTPAASGGASQRQQGSSDAVSLTSRNHERPNRSIFRSVGWLKTLTKIGTGIDRLARWVGHSPTSKRAEDQHGRQGHKQMAAPTNPAPMTTAVSRPSSSSRTITGRPLDGASADAPETKSPAVDRGRLSISRPPGPESLPRPAFKFTPTIKPGAPMPENSREAEPLPDGDIPGPGA